QLRQSQPRERRHEEDAAADAEHAGENAGGCPEEHGERIGHWTSIRIAIATRSAAKRSDSVRTGRRCCNALPPAAPSAAGTPRRSAYAGSTSPCTTYVTTPAVAVMPIAPSDVAVAARSSHLATIRRSGTITIPPPTPKSA